MVALEFGLRGLPGRSSLARLLAAGQPAQDRLVLLLDHLDGVEAFGVGLVHLGLGDIPAK